MGRKSIASERRQDIVEAFYSCVVEFGLSGASIRKTAERAGVKPSILHHYFSGREEIIEEAVIYFTDMIFQAFHEKMKQVPAKANTVNEGLEFMFSKEMMKEAYTGFFLECCVAAKNNERIRSTLAQLFERFRSAILEALEDMEGYAQLLQEERRLLATMIVAIHEGIELQWFAEPESVNLEQVLEMTQDMIQYFLEHKLKSEEKTDGT